MMFFDIENLTPALWMEYVRSPSRDNLIACLMVCVVSWDFEPSPHDRQSYEALSSDEFAEVSAAFGAELVAYNARQQNKRTKKRKKRRRAKKRK